MMKLRDKIKEDAGLQYVVDDLQVLSAVGRRRLMEQEWLHEAAAVAAEHDNIARLLPLIASGGKVWADLRHRLMELHDIQGTLSHLSRHSHLNEVELFEVKAFAYLCMAASSDAATLGVADLLAIPDVKAVFALLDPDQTHIPNFYIYDSYHPDLGNLRKALKSAQATLDAHQGKMTPEELTALNEKISSLFAQQNMLQQEVVVRLSEQLWQYAAPLSEALERMAYADLLIAKSEQAVRWGLSRPTLTERQMSFEQLSNPRLQQRNESLGLRYQKVDVSIREGLTLVTGANMAGKTVLLKTIGVAQQMLQFGFYVPAARATMPLVADVASCIGDEQDEMNGLSSFASEIIKISTTLQRTAQERLLVLIDEPARTTNPVEGKAILQAIGEMLSGRESLSLVTTHYSQLGLDCRKLRVKGFVETLIEGKLTPDNINQFMDYSLVEDSSDEVPHEALRIASILNCDSEMIALAKQKLAEG